MTRRQERHVKFDAELVRRTRKARGLTNEELALEVGVTLRTVQRWQLGEAEPSGLHVVLRLAKALGIEDPAAFYLEEVPAA